MSVNPKSSAKRSFVTFIVAFLIGGTFTYFMFKTHSNLLMSQSHSESIERHEGEENDHDLQSEEEHEHEHEHEQEHEHEHEQRRISKSACHFRDLLDIDPVVH